MIRRLLAAALRRLGFPGTASGGIMPPYRTRPEGEVLVYLSPGEYRPHPRRTP